MPLAILHLCKRNNVATLFLDPAYHELKKPVYELASSVKEKWPLHITILPEMEQDRRRIEASAAMFPFNSDLPIQNQKAYGGDVAYLFHTSGTSTGLPNSIPQTHYAAVGALPTFSNCHDKATFTTTPLYHGGLADCFRAWTSGAMIWLFPGADVPITTSNVLRALDCTHIANKLFKTPKVTFFSCVPYVMEMMGAEKEGLKVLKDMEIVGVGGAALPQNLGDELVKQGVNLISRFGSAECGFLMSSHRDYGRDNEWQYLRNHTPQYFNFRWREDGLAELIVLPTWPHIAKRNQPDGSYATADLFVAHPTIRDAWKYHSRADSQLILVTGKKFDPAPSEAAIRTCPLVQDVLIFGNGQPYPGALIFRSPRSADMTNEDFISAVWPFIESLNTESQEHTRLSRSMLVVMPSDSPNLVKSSKGTTMRGPSEENYAAAIMLAYKSGLQVPTDGFLNAKEHATVLDEDVPAHVLKIVRDVLENTEVIPENEDLFTHGVDSVACMRIRARLQSQILPRHAAELPINIVYDYGTIARLSRCLIRVRKGQRVDKDDEVQLMEDLVNEYGVFNDASKPSRVLEAAFSDLDLETKGHTVLLTGATGALGAHILSLLCSSPDVSQIHCLVRARSDTEAGIKVARNLMNRKMPALHLTSSKVRCHTCKFSRPKLDLSDELYHSLAARITVIIHAAWDVNFNLRLSSFVADHTVGMQSLINFALASPNLHPPQFIFCSSTASVLGPNTAFPIREEISHDPLVASPLGYSRSKWVAESICEVAHTKTRMRDHITVLRIGQLCGDTKNGIWNMTEAWPMLLSTIKVTNSLPDLKEEKLGWLPVDIAAKAVLELALVGIEQLRNKQTTPVYHILNPSTHPTWSEMLQWLRQLSPGFEIVSPGTWLWRLKTLHGKAADHPARKLLGLWTKTFYEANESAEAKTEIVFEMEQTKEMIPTLRDTMPIDKQQFGRLWKWIAENQW